MDVLGNVKPFLDFIVQWTFCLFHFAVGGVCSCCCDIAQVPLDLQWFEAARLRGSLKAGFALKTLSLVIPVVLPLQ